MELGLRGKSALICGASSGLGFAVAEVLAFEGCRVAISARTPSDLRRAADTIREDTGSEVLAIPADVSVPSEAERAVRETIARFGALDILLANAGGPPPGPFLTHDHAAWVKGIETNLLSTVTLFRSALPGMTERKWGRLIVLTSLSALEPLPALILSSAARAGVHGLVKGLADEIGPAGVTVNAVCPGLFETDRMLHLLEARAQANRSTTDKERGAALQKIPVGRFGKPGELAALVAYLASERAGFVTGQSIRIDGGQGRSI